MPKPGKGKAVSYKVTILHERPEHGVGVEFLATYYAKEENDADSIEEKFKEAFITAHPSWIIKKITVKEVSVDFT